MASNKEKKKEKKAPSVELKEPNLALQIANRYLQYIIVLIIVIVLFVGYSFVLDERIADVQNAASESIPAKQKVLSDLRAIKLDLDQVVRDFDAIRASRDDVFDRLDLLLPQSSDHSDLFTVVNEITEQAGLSMNSISIAFNEGSAPLFQEAGTVGAAPQPNVLAASIGTMTLNIAVEGGDYETFKAYLDSLERNIRLFDVKSLSFDGGAFSVGTDGFPGVPNYSIEMVTYYQIEEDV